MRSVKLLLHVAEETISLSNRINEQEKPGHKVITIKKIEVDEVKREIESITTPEEKKQFIQIEIDALERELSLLEEKKQSMIEEMGEYITREKEAWEITKQEEREVARKEGFQSGFAQGKKAVLEEYKDLLNQANAIAQTAEDDYHKTVAQHQMTVLQLAVQVSEKIICEKIKEDPTVFMAIVKQAIEQLIDKSNVAIYLHPDDYKIVQEQKEELEQLIDDDEVLSLYIEQDLQQGDCLIKHPFGQIDASIDTQLQQVKKALEEKLMENQ